MNFNIKNILVPVCFKQGLAILLVFVIAAVVSADAELRRTDIGQKVVPKIVFDEQTAEDNYVLDTIRNYKTGLSRGEELKLAQVIIDESSKYNLDPMFVLALIEKESSFFNWARSDRGAMGLMQIREYVGKDIASDLNIDWNGEHTLLDPYMNVRIGLYYFNVLKDKFDKTELALAAYNFGPTYVRDMMDADEEVSLDFANRVVAGYKNHMERFKGVYRL